MGLAYLLLASLAAEAIAAPSSALPVHAMVVADPVDGEQGALIAQRVGFLLQTTGYVVLNTDVLEGRIAETPHDLHRRCQSDPDCWRETGLRAGIEQAVLVDLIDDTTFGLRIVDMGTTMGFRKDKAGLTAGWPDPGLVERMFQGWGTLQIDGLPETAQVQIDGSAEHPTPHGLAIDPITAGKHSFDFRAEGYAPLFLTVMIYPDQETAVLAPMAIAEPEVHVRRSGMGWVAVGLIAGGVTAVALGASGGIAGPLP